MVSDCITEVIFIGLPGPTHHYGGLSADNVAAVSNRGSASNPKLAALQALELVRLLMALGVKAAIVPPQLRPHMGLLHQHFTRLRTTEDIIANTEAAGDRAVALAKADPASARQEASDDEVIVLAAKNAPEMLEKASSSSAMWTANAATVAPSVDCADGKLHITTANLHTNLHRRIEAEATYHTLAAIFKDVPACVVYPPLFPKLRDEGAANHMRLSPSHAAKGLHVFSYSNREGRQDLKASQAVAKQHKLPEAHILFVAQNPDIIRAGVFHNDVIAVSNEYVLLAHEKAYAAEDFARIEQAYAALHPGKKLLSIIIPEAELSVAEAVSTYLFNSQIITRADGKMTLIAPVETQTLYNGKAAKILEKIAADAVNPIDDIRTIDLRQSMRNGGGPACLRLRVPMNDAQLAAITLADEALLSAITKIIEKYYPNELSPQDLGNPQLYHNCKAMLAELLPLMKLPRVGG